MGKFSGDAAAADAATSTPAATPAARKPRTPAAAKPAAEAPTIALLVGGDQVVPLVEGSPLHGRAVKYLEAVYAE